MTHLTKTRLETIVTRLRRGNFYEDYDAAIDNIKYLQTLIDAKTAPTWQPIETCNQSPCIVFYDGDVGEADNRRLQYDHYEKDEWWWANLDSEYGDKIYPTHWMPPPTPPEKSE
ncbi:hypothetical protein [Dyadobacter psychrotolerans]|uniref:DUF551 domain-containing protein n=1 Tax=Dyadobacter psychrotolerans TaxID=2541721 RepID=A0A4R5E184_9BACT|nr:hypothetical protein [Dyadobacter psychrotolerans]TDE17695.1 hypothetical protein E0F88_07340 [Dyadobacter psychrotolerans]